MDLVYSGQHKAFRQEIRDFIAASLPDDLRQRLRAGGFASKADTELWQRRLNARGWGAPAWPKAFGGTGWDAAEQQIFADECACAPAPPPHIFNITMLGPVLIHFGSDAQRETFLPKLLNADIQVCQGFSEPNAGSDLASLKTRAERTADGYLVNGQKLWTSQAHYSDWIFCLVRTDPDAPKPQAGISLLIDLKSPGITVRPIVSIDGRHSLNEVFFDNVLVPDKVSRASPAPRIPDPQCPVPPEAAALPGARWRRNCAWWHSPFPAASPARSPDSAWPASPSAESA
ncbi:putative enzyme [Cupriavidus necator]|uniref:Putative enzyme n=1 Tax=Cupriavidus necator TaxID=106590 RepID=A0A1K0IPN8_CUPNE|nr:putative enzyme [Cupriavidus necator]